jgi:DNA-binding MarR family transcriptional regulator
MATEATLLKVFRATCPYVEKHGGEGYPGARKVAGRARVDKENVGPAWTELERMGWLRIVRPEERGKAWMISLTPLGAERWREMKREGKLSAEVSVDGHSDGHPDGHSGVRDGHGSSYGTTRVGAGHETVPRAPTREAESGSTAPGPSTSDMAYWQDVLDRLAPGESLPVLPISQEDAQRGRTGTHPTVHEVMAPAPHFGKAYTGPRGRCLRCGGVVVSDRPHEDYCSVYAVPGARGAVERTMHERCREDAQEKALGFRYPTLRWREVGWNDGDALGAAIEAVRLAEREFDAERYGRSLTELERYALVIDGRQPMEAAS